MLLLLLLLNPTDGGSDGSVVGGVVVVVVAVGGIAVLIDVDDVDGTVCSPTDRASPLELASLPDPASC